MHLVSQSCWPFSRSTTQRLACSNACLITHLWMSDIALQSFCKPTSLSFPPNDAALMKIHVAGSEAWPWNPPSLAAFECLLPKGWKKKRSAVDLQPRLHKTQKKMNESSGSISRVNEEEKTEESWKQQWQAIPYLTPGSTTKVDPNPWCENPLPFFLAQRPSLAVGRERLGQQTNRPGKKRHPYHP